MMGVLGELILCGFGDFKGDALALSLRTGFGDTAFAVAVVLTVYKSVSVMRTGVCGMKTGAGPPFCPLSLTIVLRKF